MKILRLFLPIVVFELLSRSVFSLLRLAAPGWEGVSALSAAVTAALILLLFLPGYLKELAVKEDAVQEKQPETLMMGALLAHSRKNGDRTRPGKSVSRKTFVIKGALCFLGGMAANVLFSYLLQAIAAGGFFSNEVQEQLLRSPLWLQAAGICLLVPAAEELIYRGLFYGKLRNWRIHSAAAALLSAALFAVGHGNMLQFLYAFPMGLLLAFCYESGGLLYPILFHVGANLLTVAVSLR